MRLRPFELEAHFSKWEFRARHHLAASDVESFGLRELLALAEEADLADWNDHRLGYVETWGSEALRGAIATTYAGLGPEHVLAFAGAEEGLFCAMHALLGPDDHAIVTVPNYQSMETVPLSLAARVDGIGLRPENGWRLDLDELVRLFRPNTRLVCINFPHNPTGAVLDRETFSSLVRLCAERGIHLFGDEVYRGLERNLSGRPPQAAEAYERGLSLGVLSKAYGLAGLRVGWVATKDRAALERMEKLRHYLSICNAAPSERLAVIALKARDRILATQRARVHANLERLRTFFAAHADRYEWSEPAGGCIAFPRYVGPEGVEAHCQRLLEQASVLLLPASVYRSELLPTPVDRFRVGFGRATLEEGLAAWGAALATSAA